MNSEFKYKNFLSKVNIISLINADIIYGFCEIIRIALS